LAVISPPLRHAQRDRRLPTPNSREAENKITTTPRRRSSTSGLTPTGKILFLAWCPSLETIEALEGLLAAAEIGEVTGIAYAVMLKKRDGQKPYFVDVTGSADSSPTYARGMVRALDDMLGKIEAGAAAGL
jgi:hypothetical protein